MVTLLVWLLILLIFFGVVILIIRMIPLPAPWTNVAIAIVALIFLLIVLSAVMGGVPLAPIRLQ